MRSIGTRQLVLACLLSSTALADERQALLFDQATFVTGDRPTYSVQADFDGDGLLDVVTTGSLDGILSICLGNAAGSFAAPRFVSTGLTPRDLECADVNQDGFLDLLLIDVSQSVLLVLFGDVGASFATSQTTQLSATPLGLLEPRDLDSDGLVDVLIDLSGTSAVLLRGDGTGGFSPPEDVPFVYGQARFAEVDGDGIVDLVDVTASDELQVYFLDANGGFTAGPTTPLLAAPRALELGDWNVDGEVDVAVTFSNVNLVRVHLGDGTGAFPTFVDTSTSFEPDTIRYAELGGDGHPDLFVEGGTMLTDGFVLVGSGDGTGGFDWDQSGFLASTSALYAPDANRDGASDLLTLENDDRFHVVLSDGAGRLQLPEEVPIFSLYDMDQVEVNGDGRLDLVAVTGLSPIDAHVFLANGSGSFSRRTFSMVETGFPRDVAGGDLDGDGVVDMAIALGDKVLRVYLQSDASQPVEDAVPTPSGADVQALSVVDLDGDAALDVVAVTHAPDEVLILRGGAAAFDVPMPTAQPAPYEPAYFDLDGDGIGDLVLGVGGTTGSPGLSIHLGTGAGGFAPPSFVPATVRPEDLAPGDLDGDGDLDLVGVELFGSTLFVWENDGAGGLTAVEVLLDSSSISQDSVALADLEGDGDLDVFVMGELLHVFRNDGAGVFDLAARSYVSSFVRTEMFVDDYDDDGTPDVVVGDGHRNAVVLFPQRALQGATGAYGSGVNPPGSLTVTGGTAALGSTLTVGIDNPLGTQQAGAIAGLALSLGPAVGYPGGVLVPGWGMAGGAGELLVDVSPGVLTLPLLGGTPWAGPGTPADVDLGIPNLLDFLGREVYLQGFLLDLGAGSVPIGLTNGLQVVLGGL